MDDKEIYTAIGEMKGRLDSQDKRIDGVGRQIVQVGQDIMKKLDDMKADDEKATNKSDAAIVKKLEEMKEDDKEREKEMEKLKHAATQIEGGWLAIKIATGIGAAVVSSVFYLLTKFH
jgi:hypothetical protein